MFVKIKNPSGVFVPTDASTWYMPVATATGFNSDFVAFSTATPFTGVGAAMGVGRLYVFVATADCWMRQSANATTNPATKAVGSIFLKAGSERLIYGSQGLQISVLQDVASGNASLCEVTV
jgi:hypothetical protein